MIETYQSEYGQLKSVVLKHPQEAFKNTDFIQRQWKKLNYLEPPNFALAKDEYEAFTELLTRFNIDIHFLPQHPDACLDSIYARDASIATDLGMVLCHMGKSERRPEADLQGEFFVSKGMKIKGKIHPPGTLEGGDTAWIDKNTLAVGRGYRTNDDGIVQLKQILGNSIEVLVYHLPHYRGPSDVFHLMSVFSPLDRAMALVYSPLMPVPLRQELLHRGFELIEVPEQEFDSLACNVLAVAPKACIIVKGNPLTKKKLEQSGVEVWEYQGEEISKKGCGGPTCLTRPLQRVTE